MVPLTPALQPLSPWVMGGPYLALCVLFPAEVGRLLLENGASEEELLKRSVLSSR